jgi:hypothetical protein
LSEKFSAQELSFLTRILDKVSVMEFNDKINIDTITLPQDPIFIVGFSRSGTTLLQALLTTQKNMYSLPETHFFNIIYSTVGVCKNIPVKTSYLEPILNKVNEMMGLSFSRNVINKLRTRIDKNDLYLKDLFEIIVYPYLCKQLSQNDINSIRWIEKTPFHYNFIDMIETFYPQARFINIIRNPVHTIHSRKTKIPTDKNKSVKKMSHQWNAMVDSYNNFKQKNPDKVYLIRYENLVNKTEENMEALCRFLNVAFNSEHLAGFWKKSREFIQPWEKWKDDVSSKVIYNDKTGSNLKAGFTNTLIIQALTGRNMIKYNYPPAYRHSQFFFNLILYPFHVLNETVATIKNIWKK